MKYRVTLVKSPLGYSFKTRLTAKALGLRKMNRSVEVDADNKAVMGMVNKIKHVLKLEVVEGKTK